MRPRPCTLPVCCLPRPVGQFCWESSRHASPRSSCAGSTPPGRHPVYHRFGHWRLRSGRGCCISPLPLRPSWPASRCATSIAAARNANRPRKIDGFWEVIDEVQNSVLFVLLGLEAMAIALESWPFVRDLQCHHLRSISFVSRRRALLAMPASTCRSAQLLFVLTWGGLRGGLSIALALSVPRRSAVPGSSARPISSSSSPS